MRSLEELESFPQCSLDIRKLKGRENVFGIRIGKYRIFFKLYKEEKKIIVFSILPRKKAYK